MDGIRFVYDKPAAVVGTGRSRTLVVGDLHVGIERRLLRRGVRLYGATEHTARGILAIAREFSVKRIAVLGDIKDTLLYPDRGERMALERLLYMLDQYELILVRGNHDAHLDEISGHELVDEFLFGRYALLHGNRWPSDDAMQKGYIITAHNHVAVSFRDSNNGLYKEKAWIISEINPAAAARRYDRFNRDARLVMMPAFNDLILGLEVRDLKDPNTSPLLRNRVFDYRKGKVYTLSGDLIGAAWKAETGAAR